MRAIVIGVTALAVIAAAFFVGRATAPGSAPVVAAQPLESAADSAAEQPPSARAAAPSPDPRTRLLAALDQSGEERDRAVRRAMTAWLAAEGADAIRSAREHPELGSVADRMVRLALYAYPEIFEDDPTLLGDDPDREQLIAMSVSSIAGFDPALARTLALSHLADSQYGGAMLGAVEHFEALAHPPSLADARTELAAILDESDMMKRLPRLMLLVERLASSDPASAAGLIDEMPRASRSMAVNTLVHRWSETDPRAAADWLASQDAQIARQGWPTLAQGWAERNLDAASAYADTLTGNARTVFLVGLASATARMPTGTTQTWLSRYRDDPAYADLVRGTAGQLAQQDLRAAMSLIEELPDAQRLGSYQSVIPMLAMRDPEAAVDVVDQIEDDATRTSLIPMVATMWAQNDAHAALDWASDRPRGQARDNAITQVASVLAWIDPDLAIDAIDEVDDPQARKATVSRLLVQLGSEEEAVRVGRRYDIDRDAVLALRERSRTPFGTVGVISIDGSLPP